MERLSPAIPNDTPRCEELPTLGAGILGSYTTPMKKELGNLPVYLANLNCDTTFQPNCPEAWELYRPLIEDLWLRQNLPLKEVTIRMRADYNFKASEKQFRDHAKKWNLRKYKTDRDGRSPTSSPVQHPRTISARRVSTGLAPGYVPKLVHHRHEVRRLLRPTVRATLFHQTAFERLVECGLVGLSDYVYGHSEQHEEWKRTTKFEVVINDGPFFLSFNLVGAALVFYHQKDYVTFGVFIREAFRRIEYNLQSINPGLVVEVLLHVPYLLVSHGPWELLCHYIYHLACYANVALRTHPIYNTIMAITSSLHRKDGVQQLRNWITTAAQLWEDIYLAIRGPMDKNVINARSERFYISGTADEQSVEELVSRCKQLHQEAASALGPTHIRTLELERKVLAVQAASAIYLPEFPSRCERLIARLEALRNGPDSGQWTDDHWDVYRKVNRFMACYWATHAGSDRAIPHWEKCLEGDFKNESSRVWVLKVLDELEMKYAEKGLAEKYDWIRRRKTEICKSIKDEIERVCLSRD